MKSALRTAYAGLSTVVLTGACSSWVTLLSFINPRGIDGVVHFWADAVLKASGVRSVVKGLENLPESNFVLVVNHQSNFDVMVLFRHIERHMRLVAKQQLRRVPVFGYAAERAGNIFVDRSGGRGDKAKLQVAATKVREQVSVVFFAEGTRSEDGTLAPFKKGAAVMALEAQVPLVPVAIAGTHRIVKKGSIAIHPRPAALVIGKPFPTVGLTDDAREALTTQAQAEVARLLDEGNKLVEELEAASSSGP